MKLLSSLQDVPELQKDTVHLRNKEELLGKINKLIKDGYNNLQIVTDFDHTLTRHCLDNGNTVLTSFGKWDVNIGLSAANFYKSYKNQIKICCKTQFHFRNVQRMPFGSSALQR